MLTEICDEGGLCKSDSEGVNSLLRLSTLFKMWLWLCFILKHACRHGRVLYVGNYSGVKQYRRIL